MNTINKFPKKPSFAALSRSSRKRKTLIVLAMILAGFLVALAIFYRSLDSRPAIANYTVSSVASTDAHHAELQNVEFTRCFLGGGTNCIVDGDTFRFKGEKIRIADIDAPETHPPNCQREADLGRKSTMRLQELLNAGTFELKTDGRDEDEYGRKLRIVTRNGRSLGLQLVAEGLATRWGDARKPWC